MGRSEIGRTGARFGASSSRHTPDPEHPHGRPPGEPAPEPTPEPVAPETVADEDPVGLTGARFGGTPARRSRRTRRERAADRAAAAAAAQVPPASDTTTAEPPAHDAWDTVPLPAVVDDPGPPESAAFTPVRPYVLTGGRTQVRMELRLETLVVLRPPGGPTAAGTQERTTVLELCTRTRSVSEVAALAGVPLGVARVLIDDLASEGRLTVHGVSSAEDGPSMVLMDRVLAGLRNL